eukprot:2023525-Amphidinium_carterae.1
MKYPCRLATQLLLEHSKSGVTLPGTTQQHPIEDPAAETPGVQGFLLRRLGATHEDSKSNSRQ